MVVNGLAANGAPHHVHHVQKSASNAISVTQYLVLWCQELSYARSPYLSRLRMLDAIAALQPRVAQERVSNMLEQARKLSDVIS